MSRALVVACIVVAAASPARAEDGPRVVALPGASRAISHALSASRDAFMPGWLISPYTALTAGIDFGLVALRGRGFTARLGFHGLIELQSTRAFDLSEDLRANILPHAGSALWRAADGVSVAVALDDLAERWLGPRGALEAVLTYRHESEHATGDAMGGGPDFPGRPHMGDFVMPEAAVRIPVGARTDVELRLQLKLFIPWNGARAYTVGPGGDAIVRWRATDRWHLFSSLFAEHLWGNVTDWATLTATVPDVYLVRNLTGVILHGAGLDMQIFLAVEIGHDKGLNVFNEELRLGAGVRLAIF